MPLSIGPPLGTSPYSPPGALDSATLWLPGMPTYLVTHPVSVLLAT